jgi:hypothetical protein
MKNLLKETLEVLENINKTVKDVLWVGSRDGEYCISWEDFEKISDINYDSGYGSNEIISDLVVVGNNWWLERGEYDGSEWWNFKTTPLKKSLTKSFKIIKRENYENDLKELN